MMNKKLLNRMLQLADIKPVIKEGRMSLSNFELVKESVNGNTYAIVRENNKYYVKLTQTKENLKESDFDYLGGLANKGKKSFHSFEEATKHLNLMFEEINNHYDGIDNVNLLESNSLNEKKYVLKLNKPKAKAKTEEPSTDFGGGFDFGGGEKTTEKSDFDFGGGEDAEVEGGDEFDFGGGEDATGEDDTETTGDEFDFGGGEDAEVEGGDEFDFGSEEDDEDLNFEDDEEDEIKDIQSTTGKLGQQLRDVEDLSSDMQKWVVKSVLSAIDLDNMDTEDKKDIIRTVKKKSKEEAEEESKSFDFGTEENVEESYDSYMEDKKEKYTEKEMSDWLIDMEMAGFAGTPSMNRRSEYDNFMEDVKDNPYTPHDESKLLFDNSEEDMGFLNPNLKNKGNNLAYNQAKMDTSRHFRRDAAPNYDLKPTDKWRRHNLPFDMDFKAGYDEYMSDSDILDKFETYEQELAYNDLTDMALVYGFNIGFCHIEKTEDPEESIVYLDIKDGGKKLMKARINSAGNIEIGTMRGKNFIGEPIDTLSDFTETFGEEGKLKNMGPQREKSPERPGRETETKPGTPDKTPDRERPSRRPFNPPPHITPGEEPGPKARRRSYENYMSEDPMMFPAPAKEPSTTPSEPATKPGTPDKTPDRERPSRRPFNPPPHITPGEEPGPKARRRRIDYDSDVEFS